LKAGPYLPVRLIPKGFDSVDDYPTNRMPIQDQGEGKHKRPNLETLLKTDYSSIAVPLPHHHRHVLTQ
jgi:hypothetical protein